MKNILSCICAIALITLISCHGEREGCTDPDAINYDLLAESENNSCTFPDVSMRFVPMINDTTQMGFGQDYSINDFDVRFEQIRFYVDDITITTSKESFTSENTILATERGQLGEVGEMKVADLQEVDFSIGVDPVTNSEDPTSRSADSPLSANHPEIQWDSITGYKFLVIEGSVDVNNDGTYEPDTSEQMFIQCGLDDNFKPISLTAADSLIVDRVGYELIIEYNVRDIFADYDFPGRLQSSPDNNPEYGTEIMNNVENIFRIR